MLTMPQDLTNLAQKQHGLLSRAQLRTAGFGDQPVATRIKRGLWQEITPRVISTSRQVPCREAQLWAASLHYPRAALTGVAALELDGLMPDRSMRIDLLTVRGSKAVPQRLWRLHTSTRLPKMVLLAPRRTTPAVSVANAMAWAQSDRQAIFYATWAIQKRLVEVADLQLVIDEMPRSSSTFSASRRLALVIPGAMSSLEQRYVQLARAAGLPVPQLQARRVDSQGRERFIDIVHEYKGRRVLIEIDGIGHLAAEVQIEDQYRANEVVDAGEVLLRIPGIVLTYGADRFIEQVRRKLGMP